MIKHAVEFVSDGSLYNLSRGIPYGFVPQNGYFCRKGHLHEPVTFVSEICVVGSRIGEQYASVPNKNGKYQKSIGGVLNSIEQERLVASIVTMFEQSIDLGGGRRLKGNGAGSVLSFDTRIASSAMGECNHLPNSLCGET